MPPQAQAPAPAPTPTPQPAAPTPAPAAPEPPVSNTPPIGSPSGGGASKKVWIIGAIVAVLIVVMAAAVVALYFMFFSPAAVTKRVSNEFMNAAAAGDTQKLYEITNSTTEAEKAFIDSAAAATKGEYTLKDGAMQNGTGYYLYDLTNEQGKMGRTTVEKKDGKYIVTGYVFGSDNLALVPGSSPEPVAEPSPEPVTAPTATKPCVTESEVKAQFPTTAGSDNEMDGETTYFIETIFFQAKSTNYDFDLTDEYLDKVAAGYKKLAAGDFTINLKAKVSSNANTAEVNKLADDRAAKIRADLVSRGVPSDRILEEEPENNDSGTYGDSSERNVDIRIVTPYPCN